MSKWIKYSGNYEKQEYDVKLVDGSVIKNCWPNAGMFCPLVHYEKNNLTNYIDHIGMISGQYVVAIKSSDTNSFWLRINNEKSKMNND